MVRKSIKKDTSKTTKNLSMSKNSTNSTPAFKGFSNKNQKLTHDKVDFEKQTNKFISEIKNDAVLVSDDEYIPLKYPTDGRYQEFIKKFNIPSQDIREACSSTNTVNHSIKDYINSEINKNESFSITEIRQSLIFMNDMFEKIREENKKLFNMIKELKNIKDENVELKKTVIALEEKINILEQEKKNKNIIVSGIKQEKNENILKITENLCKSINYNLKQEDIKQIKRLPSKNKNSPILIEFFDQKTKKEIFRKKKERGPVYAEELGIRNDKNKIFLNEDLTRKNLDILRKARQVRKELNFKYVWTKEGIIFMRRTDTSTIKIIRKQEDLNNKNYLYRD